MLLWLFEVEKQTESVVAHNKLVLSMDKIMLAATLKSRCSLIEHVEIQLVMINLVSTF